MDLIERQRILNYCEALIKAENTDGDEWSHSYARERVSQTEVIMDFVDALPSAQTVLTCDGCKHIGTYDTNFPCNGCVRREKDYYEPE